MFDEEFDCCELDENYCDECGHFHPELAPDGKDLYESYIERTPNEHAALSLQMTILQQGIRVLENKLFRALDTLEFHISNRLDKLQRDIDLANEVIVNHLYPEKEKDDWDNIVNGHYPDDFDTQQQVEETISSWCLGCRASVIDCLDCPHNQSLSEPIFIEDEPQEELPPDFFSETLGSLDQDYPDNREVKATIYSVDGERSIELKFPNVETALKWAEAI